LRLGLTPQGGAVIFNSARPVGGMRELGRHALLTRPGGVEPVESIADTSIRNYDQNMSATWQDDLEAAGVPTILAYKKDQVVRGLELMDEMFWRASQGAGKGLQVMDDCQDFRDEAKYLRWDDKKEDTPIGDDDLIDPARYIIVMDPWMMVKVGVISPEVPVSYAASSFKEKDNRVYASESFDLDIDEDEDEDEDDEEYDGPSFAY